MLTGSFYTKRALAARYNTHEGTLSRWVREKRFPPPIKLTPKGMCRWPEQAVLDWEAAQFAKATGASQPETNAAGAP